MLSTMITQDGRRLRAPQLIASSSDSVKRTTLTLLQCFLENGVKMFQLGHCATASTLQACTRGSQFKSRSFRHVICPFAFLGLWQDATFDSSNGRGSSSQMSRGFICSPRMAHGRVRVWTLPNERHMQFFPCDGHRFVQRRICTGLGRNPREQQTAARDSPIDGQQRELQGCSQSKGRLDEGLTLTFPMDGSKALFWATP